MYSRHGHVFSIAALAFAAVGCATTPDYANVDAEDLEIIHRLKADGRFKTLVKLLEESDADDDLDDDALTLFAPTDAAFAKLPEGTVVRNLQSDNLEVLRLKLQYHIARPDVTTERIRELPAVDSISGFALPIEAKDDKLIIANAVIVEPNLRAKNGIVHVVDRVLVPPPNYYKKLQEEDRSLRKVHPDQWYW